LSLPFLLAEGTAASTPLQPAPALQASSSVVTSPIDTLKADTLVAARLADIIEQPACAVASVPVIEREMDEGPTATTKLFTDDGRLFIERDYTGGDVPRFSTEYPEGLQDLVSTTSLPARGERGRWTGLT